MEWALVQLVGSFQMRSFHCHCEAKVFLCQQLQTGSITVSSTPLSVNTSVMILINHWKFSLVLSHPQWWRFHQCMFYPFFPLYMILTPVQCHIHDLCLCLLCSLPLVNLHCTWNSKCLSRGDWYYIQFHNSQRRTTEEASGTVLYMTACHSTLTMGISLNIDLEYIP